MLFQQRTTTAERVAARSPSVRRWAAAAIIALAIASGASVSAAAASFQGCRSEFFGREAPTVRTTGNTYALCADDFATLYSAETKTPLYSAEHLTEGQIASAIHMRRVGVFHEDARLPPSDAAQLRSFFHSGYDRGHMAPSGDEPDAASQMQSFVLSNMIPQNADDNRNLWADIEMAVRELVLAGGDDVYVVTGPIFRADDPPPLRGGVQVPAMIFKAVLDPRAGIAGVYVVRNAPGHRYWSMSLAQFAAEAGIVPFPAASSTLVEKAPDLPQPRMLRHHGHGWH